MTNTMVPSVGGGFGKRLLAMVLCLSMVLSMEPVPAFAEGCTHHPEHTAECGYVAEVASQPCGHEHDAACGYQEAASCAHQHDGTCGYREAVQCNHVCGDGNCGYAPMVDCNHVHTEECGENGESCAHFCGDGSCAYFAGAGCDHSHNAICGYQEAAPCTHSCADGTCGYREAHDCTHQHDESCGYREAVTGSPCNFVCEICNQTQEQPEDTQNPEDQEQNGDVTGSCICEKKCESENATESCQVCAADYTKCEGKEITLCAHGQDQEECALCPVQALIDALPTVEELTAETEAQTREQLATVKAAVEALTAEEQALLTLDKYTALTEYFAALDEATTEPTEPIVIADWQWIDEWEIIDEETGLAHLPFASAENIADYESVLELLPWGIEADGVELTLGEWTCEDYPQEGAYTGEYTFETTLPEGYVLDDGTNKLTLKVILGDPEGEGESVDLYAGKTESWPSIYMGVSITKPQRVSAINESYYEITTKEELYWLHWYINVNGEKGASNLPIRAAIVNNITVNADISADPATLIRWEPLNADYIRISGRSNQDNQYHIISGLYCEATNAGFVGTIGQGSFVTKIGIVNSYFKTTGPGGTAGAICAELKGGSVTYCKNVGTTIVGADVNQGVDNTAYLGGVVGVMHAGTIFDCQNTKNIGEKGKFASVGGICGYTVAGDIMSCNNSGNISGDTHVGGICGGGWADISGCTNTGSVTGIYMVGGIAGEARAIASGTNSGAVTGDGNYVGGICGVAKGGISYGCQNDGDVSGADYVGGIAGSVATILTESGNRGKVTYTGKNAGGLAGTVGNAISNSFSYHTENNDLALAGGSVTVLKSYYLADSDSSASTGGTPRTAAQFKSGQVAYFISQSLSENIKIGQQIGTDDAPAFRSSYAVYRVTCSPCPAERYSNTPDKTEIVEHDITGGSPFCINCGYGGSYAIWKYKDSKYDGNPLFDHFEYYTDSSYSSDSKLNNCEFVWARLTTVGKGTFTYTSKNALPKDVGEYYGTMIIKSGDNQYNVQFGSGNTVSISKKGLTVEWDEYDVTYDKQVHLPTYRLEGAVAGDDVRLQTEASGNFIDGGSQSIRWTTTLLGRDAYNYAVTSGSKSFSIKQRKINSLTLKPKTSYSYGEVVCGIWTPEWESSDVLEGDEPFEFIYWKKSESSDNFYYPNTPNGQAYPVGRYAVKVTSLNSKGKKNYQLTEGFVQRVEFDITHLVLETPNSLASKVYTGMSQSPDLPTGLSGKVHNVTQSYQNVDEYQIELQIYNNNCTWDAKGGKTKFKITPKDLADEEVQLVPQDKSALVYNGAEIKPVIKLTFGGDNIFSNGPNPGFTVTYQNNIEGGNQAKAIVTATEGGNYTGSRTVTFSIAKASDNEWTTWPAVSNFTYGQTVTPVAYQAKYGNDKVQVTYKKQGATDSSTEIPKDAGTYDVTVALDATDSYNGLQEDLTLTISKAAPDFTQPTACDLTYNGSPQTLLTLGTASGSFVYSASENGTYSANIPTGQNAGTYTVWYKVIGDDNHKDSAAQKIEVTIKKATPTITVEEDKKTYTKTYGDAVFQLEGITENSDDAGVTYAVTKGEDVVSVDSSGKVTILKAGTATITLSLPESTNYLAAESKTVTITVNRKDGSVTITGDIGKTYDGRPFSLTTENFTADGDGTVTIRYKKRGETTYSVIAPVNAGDYTVKVTKAQGTNHNAAEDTKDFTIEKKPVTISGVTVAASKVYDGGTEAKITNSGELSANYDGEKLTIQTGSAAYDDKNVGQGKAVTFNGFQLAGDAKDNYTLTKQPDSTTAAITPKDVTITGTTVEATKVYDGSAVAEITSNGNLSDNYDGDNLTIVPGSASYDTKNVGETKTITFSGFSLGGSAKDNYTLTAQPASTTASITKKPVTLVIKVEENLFDGTNGVNYSTSLEEGHDFIESDDVAIEAGDATFASCYPADDIPVTFTDFTLTGADADNYSITNPQPEDITGSIQVSSRYLNLDGNDDFAGQTEFWVDGQTWPVKTEDGVCYAAVPETGDLLTTYTYTQGSSAQTHDNYYNNMSVYRIIREDTGARVEKIEELSNLMRYSGCSIRVTGNRGIRMITSLDQSTKAALTSTGLAGYTLVEYGTVVNWADTLNGESLTLENGKHNYAYKEGVSDPVFGNVGNLTQYTNVLVGFSLEECAKDITMRPYMILRDAQGQTVTLYGGCVTRSIGYIAWQNRDTYKPGTSAYNYVHELMALYNAA